MSVKLKRWHAAVLALTVIAVMTALFALATVKTHAYGAPYDPDTHTYTMDGGTYDQPINLDENETTINISGDNILAYGNGNTTPCTVGKGNLKIIGNGTLEISQGYLGCLDLTVDSGVKLIIGRASGLFAEGSITVDNAVIESQSGTINGGRYNDYSHKHVFNNATVEIKVADPPSNDYTGMRLNGETVLNNCNFTMENGTLTTFPNALTIDGGTYSFNNDESYPLSFLSGPSKAVIKNNAVIKANTFFSISNLEMSNSELEIKIDRAMDLPALEGVNDLTFSDSKINIDGPVYTGIYAKNNLTFKNSEVNIKAKYGGLASQNIAITHSNGTIQATEHEVDAAVAVIAYKISGNQISPGTLSLKEVNVMEPAGGSVGETSVKQGLDSQGQEIFITAILDGKAPAKTVVLEANNSSHTWDAGTVTKQPTATEDGVKTYTCTVCGATKTEAIPKLAPQAPANGEDGTPFSKGASVKAAEAAILALPNDNDPAGTAFGLLQLKASKVTKNSINLKWKAVPGAAKYIIFANKCGTGNKYKKLTEVTGTSFTATQAAGAAIQKGTYYKFMMIAADANGRVISTSKTVHAATKGGKVGNHKKVTVKKSVTKKAKKLKKGKTLKLKAKAVPQAKKLKVRKHRGIMYETSNPAVAQVNGKGTVKGVGKGTCYVYAYAQNGTCAKVKVTVK